MTHNERRIRRKEIAASIANGMSLSEVSLKYKVSSVTVRYACEENEVTIPNDKKIRHNSSSFNILALLFDVNLTIPEIAKHFNVSRQRVQQVYKKAIETKIPGLPKR